MKYEDATYHVTLDEGFGKNELSPMIEQHFYGYLSNRPLEGFTPEEVIEQLEEHGSTVVYFQPYLGGRIRVEIRRELS